MRYRLEKLPDDQLVVRNVETDIIIGSAAPVWKVDPCNPDRAAIVGYSILNRQGKELDTSTMRRRVAVVLASYEEYWGYPSLRKCGRRRPEPKRIEHLLRTLLADAVSEIACGMIECRNGGLKAKTKRKCAKLIAQLHAMWFVSHSGSFNAERSVVEPYFANVPTCSPHLSFAEAAQVHGMFELQTRYPDVSEAALKLALSWPLEMLERLVISLREDDTAPQAVGNALH